MKILRCLCLLLCLASPCFGWNAAGHKIVALIAAAELEPKLNAQLEEILSAHPFPEARDLLSASVWPDQLKSHPEYARGPWHYSNLPLFLDVPPQAEPDPGRIVEALELNIELLQDQDSSQAEKAVALAWIIHLLGDIHQPLHSTSAYSTRLPKGDRGGNEYPLKYRGELTNIHSFWDSVGGRFWKGHKEKDLKAVADELRGRFPADALVELTNPRQWRHESHVLARYFAYPGVSFEQSVTPAYAATAQAISEQRLALAGHRLAALLKVVLTPKDD